MKTPLYLPASGYTPPVVAPYELSVEGCPVAELMNIPAAWAVVLKHLPMMKMMIGIPQVRPQLGIMTIADFGSFSGRPDTVAYAAIDAELKRFPAGERRPR